MSDRYDIAVRGLIGTAVLACAATAAVLPNDTVSPQVRARWIRLADADAAADARMRTANVDPAVEHVALHTFAIDSVSVDAVQHPFDGRPLPVQPGAAITITGWAIAPGLKQTASRFVYRIDDGSWVEATYHVPRRDVAAALAMPNAADSGWEVAIPAGGLQPGPHKIALATVSANGARKPLALHVTIVVTGSETSHR